METPHQPDDTKGDRQANNNYLPLKYRLPRRNRIQLKKLEKLEAIAPSIPKPYSWRNRIRLKKTEKHLIAEIPSVGWTTGGLESQLQLVLLACSIIFAGVALFTTVLMLLEEPVPLFLPIVHWTIGLGLLGYLLFVLQNSSRLEIDEQTFRLQWKFFGFSYQIQGRTGEIRRLAELADFLGFTKLMN